MKRILLFKRKGGNTSSHGTALFIEDEKIFITSHPLTPEFGAGYLVAPEGQPNGALLVEEVFETVLVAPGVAPGGHSISPYVYQLKLAEPKAGG